MAKIDQIDQIDLKSKNAPRKQSAKSANSTNCDSSQKVRNTPLLLENIIQINSQEIDSPSSLGNITSYSPQPEYQRVKLSESDVLNLKHDYKKENIQRKKKIGRKVPRVGYCGIRPIRSDAKFIDAVQGETGGIYYRGMQRCGSVWFCPDCMYKLMKGRADELYSQINYPEAEPSRY